MTENKSIEQEKETILEGMRSEFSQDPEMISVYNSAREIVDPTLVEWSTAIAYVKFGPESEKEANRDIISSCKRTIEHVKRATSVKFSNYSADLVAEKLKDIALQYIPPLLR